MQNEKLFRLTLWLQTLYYLPTAIWPIVHIESFMWVTGPKTDIWLVKTVGALLIPISLCFLAHLFFKTDNRPVIVLAATSCIAFASVDIYYVMNDVIDEIYLGDAAVQLILLVNWIVIAMRRFSTRRT